MTAPGQKDKFTPELRILVASLLSFAVIILWAKFFGPKPPAQPPTQANRPAATAPSTSGQAAAPAANPAQTTPAPASLAPSPAVSVAVKSDSQERTHVVENTLYRAEVSNRRPAVKSWPRTRYMDYAQPQPV